MANNNFFLFNRKYFTVNSFVDLHNLNNELFNSEIVHIDRIVQKDIHLIHLNTTYPGLLIGSGYGHDYKHESESMKNEAFKIGFHFDFTTGMPIIPGSSIKGMLRSCFPQESVKTKKLSKEFRLFRADFITDILKNKLNISSDVNITALKDEIFHGISDGMPIPIYERDVFFDAVPISVNNSKRQLLDDDYITPHVKENMSYEMAMLKNPEPLKFLKVSPKVLYRFEFKLNNSRICREVTAEKKLKLLEYLLLTLGIGAKTNVGYGQFSLPDDNKNGNPAETGQGDDKNTNRTPQIISTITDSITKSSDPITRRIHQNSEWNGQIIGEKGYNVLLSFDVEGEKVVLKKKSDKIKDYVAGTTQKVRIVFRTGFVNDTPDFSVTVITE